MEITDDNYKKTEFYTLSTLIPATVNTLLESAPCKSKPFYTQQARICIDSWLDKEVEKINKLALVFFKEGCLLLSHILSSKDMLSDTARLAIQTKILDVYLSLRKAENNKQKIDSTVRADLWSLFFAYKKNNYNFTQTFGRDKTLSNPEVVFGSSDDPNTSKFSQAGRGIKKFLNKIGNVFFNLLCIIFFHDD